MSEPENKIQKMVRLLKHVGATRPFVQNSTDVAVDALRQLQPRQSKTSIDLMLRKIYHQLVNRRYDYEATIVEEVRRALIRLDERP